MAQVNLITLTTNTSNEAVGHLEAQDKGWLPVCDIEDCEGMFLLWDFPGNALDSLLSHLKFHHGLKEPGR